jgi:uncharacterized membrane protein
VILDVDKWFPVNNPEKRRSITVQNVVKHLYRVIYITVYIDHFTPLIGTRRVTRQRRVQAKKLHISFAIFVRKKNPKKCFFCIKK